MGASGTVGTRLVGRPKGNALFLKGASEVGSNCEIIEYKCEHFRSQFFELSQDSERFFQTAS